MNSDKVYVGRVWEPLLRGMRRKLLLVRQRDDAKLSLLDETNPRTVNTKLIWLQLALMQRSCKG